MKNDKWRLRDQAMDDYFFDRLDDNMVEVNEKLEDDEVQAPRDKKKGR